MAVYGLKRATPRMKYVHMNHMVEFKDQLKEHQALEHEVKLCPKCGQPLGHRPLFMVGKYDTCLGCFEQEQLARQIFEANKPYFDNMLEAIGVTYEQDGNVSDLDQTNPAEKAHLLEQAIAEQDRINQEERERRVQQVFPHLNRRVGDLPPMKTWNITAKISATNNGDGTWTHSTAGILSDEKIAAMYNKWLHPERSDRSGFRQENVYWNGDIR